MKTDTYINYIEYTLSTYSKSNKRKLINLYKDTKLVKKKDEYPTLFDDDLVNIDYTNLDNTIIECIKKNNKAIEIYEKFQFTKAYKYAVLFRCYDFEKLVSKIDEIPDYKYDNTNVKLFDELQQPTKMISNSDMILLFNKKFEAVHPQTGDELLLHYPLLAVVHKDSKLVEFRFDAIKRLFTEGDRDQTIYVKLIEELINYFKTAFDSDLSAINLDFMIEITKDESNKNIKLLSQYMFLKDGGKAQLAVGNNEEYVLPIIGELKNIINELKDELDKNVKIKDALEQFIYEKEETTDYPWIEVLFLDEEGIKTRNNHVKFIFNYMNRNYCLITYYYNDTLIEMERMNDVTRFIGENIERQN